jgi:hypothetical protein
MPNYYNINDPAALRDLPQSLLAEWAANNNPKRAEWLPAPSKPTENAVWNAGEWVTPTAPTYTAEEWTDSQGYGGNRSTTMLYQKLRLDASAKSSPKLVAVQGWLDGMIALGLAPAASNWPAAPHTFEATLTETLTSLNS